MPRKISATALEKKREEWEQGEKQTLDLLLLHPQLERQILIARKNLEIKTLCKTEEEIYEWGLDLGTEHTPEWKRWRKEMDRLLEFFGLTSNYLEAIDRYVLAGSFDGANTRKVRVDLGKRRAMDGVTIRILAPASKEEIMEAVLFANREMNLRLKRENGKLEAVHDAKRWRTWKHREKLDEYIAVYKASQQKGKDGKFKTDADVASHVFADAISNEADWAEIKAFDKKKKEQIHSIRARIEKALRERFPPSTFQTKK